MRDRKVVKNIPLEGTDQVLEVKVYYSKGGLNYFNYKSEPRGYYVSVTPVTNRVEYLQDGTAFRVQEFGCFSGLKALVKEVKRFSQKEFDAQVENLAENQKYYVQRLAEKVAEKEGLTLAQEVANV